MKNELGYPDLDEPEAIKRLEYFSTDDDWATFVAIINDEVAGFIGVMKGLAYSIDGYSSQIMALAVSEHARRKGVGTALVRKAEAWASSHGITLVAVSSNMRRLDAHALYESCGYSKTSFMFKKAMGTLHRVP